MKTLHRSLPRRRVVRGFTLIEGLIAMLVMAVGMIALVNFQSRLSIASDEAKLRTEAIRLAQQKLDELRAFEQIAVDPLAPTKVTYAGTVVSSPTPEVINPASFSNTSFSRTWTVVENSLTQKSVTVTVAWTDRLGPQNLSLSTVIGRADPAAISTLGVGPGSTVVRRPKNRNINIPYPSVSLGDNKSAFQPPGTNVVIFFDDGTGEVVGLCTGQALPTAGSTMDLSAAGCNATPGYLLSGYVRFCTSNGCGTINQPGDGQAKFANASDQTLPLNASAPILLDSSNPSATFAKVCYSAQQVTLKSDGSTVPDTGQANNQVTARFISYVCVVYPADHDGDGNTARRWWGRTAIVPSAGWTIGSSSGQYKVCRFTADYNESGTISNDEHPLWYRDVTGTVDNQNFLVIWQNVNCPTDKPTDATNGDFQNANTATHQTSGTTVTGAVLSFTCSTIACSGGAKTVIEPSDTAAPIKMH